MEPAAAILQPRQQFVSLKRVVAVSTTAVSLVIALFHLYTAIFSMLQPYAQYMTTLTMILVLSFLVRPLGAKSWKDVRNWWFLVDFAIIALLIAVEAYIIRDFDAFTTFRSLGSPAALDLIAGTVYVLALLESIRRNLGYPILVVCLFFTFQNLFAEHMWSWLYGPSVSWSIWIQVVFMQTAGIFGLVTAIVSQYLIIVLLFGATLLGTGAGQFFIDVSLGLVGRFAGGPAKIAVVASSLIAMIQGQATSNVATVGPLTIPLMKSVGYRAEFAAAVEAAASSGGVLAPPIMGATAFIMADFLGVPYLRICLAAAIPTILYYTCVFMSVHFEAKRTGLAGLPADKLPSVRSSLAWGWIFLVPIVALVFFLVQGYSIATTFLYATGLLFLVSTASKRTRLTATKLLDVLKECGNLAVTTGLACAAAGLIIGAFYVSGLGDRLMTAIVTYSGGSLFIGLVLTAIVSIVLGMAMPTIAVYITLLMLAIPALITMGAQPMVAHMFAFFYGVLSAITPPVAVAAFVAAGIAKTDPTKTAIVACKLAAVLFLVPFYIAYWPAMLFIGTPLEIALSAVTSVIGVIGLAAGLTGYLFRITRWFERLLLVAGGLLLMASSYYAMVGGLMLLVLAVLVQLGVLRKKDRTPAQSSP